MAQQHWLKSPHLGWKTIAVSALAWTIAVLLIDSSPYGLPLERIARKFDFATRSRVQKDPELHPRLKVFALDDKTVAWLRSPRLSFEEWTNFIYMLDQRQPSVIYIDQMFSMKDVTFDQAEHLDKAIETLANLATPVFVGAFSRKTAIEGRPAFDLSSNVSFDLRDWMRRGGYERISSRHVQQLRLSRARGPFVYGPDPAYRSAFTGIGHIEYDGSDYVDPVLRVTPARVVPHLAFTGLQSFDIRGGWPYYGGKRLPVNQAGRLLINWTHPKQLWPQIYALRAHLNRAFRGEDINVVRPGDVVVVLPAMFTGSTDFSESPYGAVPGGFHIVSLLNSILRNDWLVVLEGKSIIACLAAVSGGVIGAKLAPLSFGMVSVAALVGMIGLFQVLFSWFGFAFPWLLPTLAFCGSGLTMFVERARVAERKSQSIRQALDGAIAPNQVNRLARNPHLINLEARERVVTVMFVDVVGFSLMAENLLPRLAFDHLKRSLNQITKVVYEYGGIINKNLGDGLLCFFGYDIETDITMTDHAEQAAICAIKIQELCLKENLRAASAGEPVYPLRIGINTSSVYMGDLGYGERIDFTVVGNGVNFAKRLENACDPYSLLMSPTTYELVRNLMLSTQGLSRKRIQIKHHHELVEAVEYDPFFDRRELRMQAEKAFRDCASIARTEKRWLVANPDNFKVQTSVGPADILNFSNTGLSLKLPQSIARGNTIAVHIDSHDGQLAKQLAQAKMSQLLCEVRWSYQDRGGIVHGVAFTQVTEEQTSHFVDRMKNYGLSRSASTSEQILTIEAG